jgi:osmoprotectant transport system permease protein
MTELLNTIVAQKSQIEQALWEHLSLSFWALVIAILIAIPLAVSLKNSRHAGEIVLQLAWCDADDSQSGTTGTVDSAGWDR